MVLVIGLTGEIGSGKSVVANYFMQLGAAIIDADVIAKNLTVKNSYCYQRIVAYFGSNILMPSGEIQRKKLRQIIFADKNKKLWLEKLLHPIINQQIQQQIKLQQIPYCIVVIPLLLQNINEYMWLDRILIVSSSEKIQLQRIIKRDNITQKLAKQILLEQQQAIKSDIFNHVRYCSKIDKVTNIHDLPHLQQQVSILHAKYKKIS